MPWFAVSCGLPILASICADTAIEAAAQALREFQIQTKQPDFWPDDPFVIADPSGNYEELPAKAVNRFRQAMDASGQKD